MRAQKTTTWRKLIISRVLSKQWELHPLWTWQDYSSFSAVICSPETFTRKKRRNERFPSISTLHSFMLLLSYQNIERNFFSHFVFTIHPVGPKAENFNNFSNLIKVIYYILTPKYAVLCWISVYCSAFSAVCSLFTWDHQELDIATKQIWGIPKSWK